MLFKDSSSFLHAGKTAVRENWAFVRERVLPSCEGKRVEDSKTSKAELTKSYGVHYSLIDFLPACKNDVMPTVLAWQFGLTKPNFILLRLKDKFKIK